MHSKKLAYRIRLRLLILLFPLLAILAALGQKQSAVSIEQIESLIRSKDYDEALRATNTALKGRPDDFRIWTLQAIALSSKGNNPDAIKAFQKALKFSPNYLPALQGEIELLYEAQDDRAIPALERLVRIDPHNETAHEMLAVLEGKRGECQNAVGHFPSSGDAVARHPGSLEVPTSRLEIGVQVHRSLQICKVKAASFPDIR